MSGGLSEFVYQIARVSRKLLPTDLRYHSKFVTDKGFPLDDQELDLSVCDGNVCDYVMIGCN